MVGSCGEGNTYPGPTPPFGMVQLSPDTDKLEYHTASGYEYSDPTIMGFSMTHLSGTGHTGPRRLSPFMPDVGPPQLTCGVNDMPHQGYQSAFSHYYESASVGYYRVKLQKPGVTIELAAADRGGILRMTFPESDQASILTDLSHVLTGKKWKVVWLCIRIEDPSTVTGFHLVNGWAKERYLYFAVLAILAAVRSRSNLQRRKSGHLQHVPLSEPSGSRGPEPAIPGRLQDQKRRSHHGQGRDFGDQHGECLEKSRRRNPRLGLRQGAPRHPRKMETELGKIQIEGSPEVKKTFYTAMYHAFNTPNVYQDVTGEYRGLDQNVHQAKGFTNHAVFSLWDTHRAEHPLLALIYWMRDAEHDQFSCRPMTTKASITCCPCGRCRATKRGA